MKKHYETELPVNYHLDRTIDATNKRFGILMNLISLIPMTITVGLAWWLLPLRITDLTADIGLPIRLLLFSVSLFAYIVLHELVHGIAYKLLTGHKLTFGLTATVAYCGVPDIYVYRSTALAALLAPFFFFLLVFGTAIFLLPGAWDRFLASVLLGMHIGGCVGDLYDTLLYLTYYRSSDVLMKDTGPAQYFYLPESHTPSHES